MNQYQSETKEQGTKPSTVSSGGGKEQNYNKSGSGKPASKLDDQRTGQTTNLDSSFMKNVKATVSASPKKSSDVEPVTASVNHLNRINTEKGLGSGEIEAENNYIPY